MSSTNASSATKPYFSHVPPPFTGFSDYPPPPPRPLSEAERFALAARRAGAVRLDAVAKTELRWLWPGRIPLGRVTLLVSDPGLGKSLVALDIAARVTRGSAWPDEKVESQETRVKSQNADSGSLNPNPQSAIPNPQSDSGPQPSTRNSQPSSVLLLTPEDDLGDTIRPRLEALGGDCSRIVAVRSIPGDINSDDVPRAFELRRDLARLTGLLDAIPDCRLIIIDPISAYLGDTNEHANGEVQKLLLPLTTLAQKRGIAVLAVSHLRKKDGAAIHRTMGSLAFVATARAAWAISKDPSDPERRLMLPIKNNLAQDITGLAYTIEATTPGGPPTIRWSSEVIAVSAETIVGNARTNGRPDDMRQDAIQWLRKVLVERPRPSRDVREAADEQGFSEKTLRRAFRDLNGEAVRQGSYGCSKWIWRLPSQDGQNPGGEFWPSWDFPDDFASWAPIVRSPTVATSPDKAPKPPEGSG